MSAIKAAPTTLAIKVRQPTLMNRELWRKKRLTWWEKICRNPPLYFAIVGVTGLAFSITWVSTGAPALGLGILGIVSGVLLMMASAAFAIDMEDGTSMRPREREQQVRLARGIKVRAHHDQEKSRLKELRKAYVRYSIQVKAEQGQIHINAVKHHARNKFFTPFLPWNSEVSTTLFDSLSGKWRSEGIQLSRISDPTPEKVQKGIEKAQELIADLEENSYQEALKKHELDMMAMAMQPPPTSAATIKRVSKT